MSLNPFINDRLSQECYPCAVLLNTKQETEETIRIHEIKANGTINSIQVSMSKSILGYRCFIASK